MDIENVAFKMEENDCPLKIQLTKNGEGVLITLDGVETKMIIEKLQEDHGGPQATHLWVPDFTAWLKDKLGVEVSQTQAWAIYLHTYKLFEVFKKKLSDGLVAAFGTGLTLSKESNQQTADQAAETPLE